MRKASLAALAFFLFAVAAPAPARADGPTAEELFREGRTLMDAGSLEQACAKFAESQKLEPAAGTLLNLAECQDHRGLYATAASTYKEAAVAAALRNRKDWERLALDRYQALVPMIPVWTIRVEPAARAMGVLLTLDDRPIKAEDGDRLLDPGAHTLTATAPGRKTWTQTVTFVKGSKAKVTVPILDDDKPARESATPAAWREEPKSSWTRPTGIAVGAVGVAGVAFGAVAGVLALGAKSDADKNCPAYPACYPQGVSDNDRAQTWATVSTVGLGAGLVLVAAGAFLAFVVPSF